MTKEQWDWLRERSPETYLRAYRRFMYRESNSGKCNNCPEADRLEIGHDQLRCGQYHCWVDCHCQ